MSNIPFPYPTPSHPYNTGCRCYGCGVLHGTPAVALTNHGLRNFGEAIMTRESAAPDTVPTSCAVCNHHNEYAGPEHILEGMYICRTCRPAYERKAAIRALEKENAERKVKDPSRWWST